MRPNSDDLTSTDNAVQKDGSHRNQRTSHMLALTAVAMLALGFASKPLYDTFCKITGYGGTTRTAETNTSEILDRVVTVAFDANVSGGLPWDFKPDVRSVDVNVGRSNLAYYTVTNTSNRPVTGTATFNVTPIKAAPFFIKTECFCFTEQTLKAGETMSFPVLFHIDSQIAEYKRMDDVKQVTLSYTFFETEPSSADVQSAAQSREANN